MDAQTATIAGAVIGGFLSAGAGVALDFFRERGRQKRTRSLLVTAICDDLQHSIGLYDKVLQDWLEKKTIYFSTLNEIRESRQTYQNNKDWIHIFEDSDLRRSIFRYYLQSADSINLLEYNQRRKYEIEKKYNETLTKIKIDNTALPDDDAKKLALSYTQEESKEFVQLDTFIADAMLRLSGFKETAKSLAEQLRGKQK